MTMDLFREIIPKVEKLGIMKTSPIFKIMGLLAAFFFVCTSAFAQTPALLSQGQVLGNFGTGTIPAKPTTILTFPVISGNLACFSGTTGLLQDCGTRPGTFGQFVIGTGTNADAFTDHGQTVFYFPNLAADLGCFCNTFVGNGGTSLTHSVVNTTSSGIAVSATVTVTIAAPGVVTWTAHGLAADTPVAFTSSASLPTGITSRTTYFVARSPAPTTNTFSIAATVGGTAITTSGSQSGTQTGYTIGLEGRYNIAIGQQALPSITNGAYDTATGFEAMFNTTSGSFNTVYGEAGLFSNTTGNGNTAVGWKALVGTAGVGFGDYNTAVGHASGWAPANSSATTQNTSIGAFSLGAGGLTGNANVAAGYLAGVNVTSGSNNVAVGPNAAPVVTTGSNNTMIGPVTTGAGVTTGSNNTIIGNCPAQASAAAGVVMICDGAGNVGLVSRQITTQVFTSGSGTYTPTAGARWLEITLIGGGGGGAGGGSGSPGNGGNGGDTCLALSGAACTSPVYDANGGTGATAGAGAGGVGGVTSGSGTINIPHPGGKGGTSHLAATNEMGGMGGPSGCLAAGGMPGIGSTAADAAQPNTGGGGGGGGGSNTVNTGAGGGGAGCAKIIINSPGASYTYAIGAGGTGGTLGGFASPGGAGGTGWFYVIEH